MKVNDKVLNIYGIYSDYNIFVFDIFNGNFLHLELVSKKSDKKSKIIDDINNYKKDLIYHRNKKIDKILQKNKW